MKFKKTILSVVACAIAMAMTLAFTACGPKDKPEETATVTAIEIKSTAEIDTGDTENLIVQVTYSDGTTKKTNDNSIEWKSSDENVATVMRGIVTGKARGTANITATVGEGDAQITSNTCAVTVHSLEFAVTGEGVEDNAVTIDLNESLQLAATVKKDDVAVEDAEITWATSSATFVTVSEDGLITGLNPGSATITAKYNTREVSVEVTVRELAGAAKMTDKEQNKAPANSWGYWNDLNYNWAQTTVEKGAVYTEPYNEPEGDGYIGAGKVNITFKIDSYKSGEEKMDAAAIQLFYRSAGEEGKLITNHNYELTLKLETTASGTVSLNDYSKLPDNPLEGVEVGEITEGDDYSCDFEVEAGKVNTITVRFRHGDTGEIYADGKYSNVESAIQLCLGLLGKPGADPVKVTVYDICYTDLGEATNKWQDNPENLPGYVDPDAPVIPDDPEVLPLGKVTATGVTLTVEDEKAVFNLSGTVDMSAFDNDVEAAKTWLNATHFDLQECSGSWSNNGFSRLGVTVDADGNFTIKYDITRLKVDDTADGSTGAYSAHFTEKESTEDGYSDNKYRDLKLNAEQAVAGENITVGTKKYIIVNYQAGTDFEATEANSWGQAYNYGCVSIKVENVSADAE